MWRNIIEEDCIRNLMCDSRHAFQTFRTWGRILVITFHAMYALFVFSFLALKSFFFCTEGQSTLTCLGFPHSKHVKLLHDEGASFFLLNFLTYMDFPCFISSQELPKLLHKHCEIFIIIILLGIITLWAITTFNFFFEINSHFLSIKFFTLFLSA